MKRVLTTRFYWKELESGLLKEPESYWSGTRGGGSHPLSKGFKTRVEAIHEYSRFMDDAGKGLTKEYVPQSMILVEEHSVTFNWDE